MSPFQKTVFLDYSIELFIADKIVVNAIDLARPWRPRCGGYTKDQVRQLPHQQ
jgi:hypothetical protein